MVNADLYGALFGCVVASAHFVMSLLLGWYRVPLSRWMGGILQRAPFNPYFGGADAAKNSTPGRYLFISVAGVPLSLVLVFKTFSLVWEWPNPIVRVAAILAATGGILLLIGGILVVYARVTARSSFPWVGVALVALGMATLATGVALLLG